MRPRKEGIRDRLINAWSRQKEGGNGVQLGGGGEVKEGCDGRGKKGEGGKGGEEGGEGKRRGRERRDRRGRIKRGGEEDGSLGGIQFFFGRIETLLWVCV